MVIWHSFRTCSNAEGFEIDIDTVEHMLGAAVSAALLAALVFPHQVK